LKHERTTEELKETAALYVLGSLTQQEARSFENHIKDGCLICEAERRKCEHAIAALGLSAEEIIPPEYIRDLLSARIEREPQTAPPPAQGGSVVEERTITEPLRPRAPSFSLLSESRDNRSHVFPWVIAVIVAIFGILAAYEWKSVRDLNTQLQASAAAARTDAEDLRAKLDSHKTDLDNLEQILGSIEKPGVRIARLVGQTSSPSSSAAVIWDKDKGNCLILGSFPPAPAGKSYQLWFFTPMAKVPVGSFQSGSANRVFAALPVPGNAANASVAVVTLEPDNGSKIPSFPYYALGRIN
jgi:anti-sigma-K factor RskA